MSAERRTTRTLMEYWNMLREDRAFPSEAEVDPSALDEIWPRCFLIKYHQTDEAHPFRYSYLGDSLIEAYGDDLTGHSVYDALLSPHMDNVIKNIHQTITDRRPVLDDSEFVNKDGVRIQYRLCLLPLGPDDETVNYVLGAMHWRAI